jgi:hypothetical protein
VTNEQSDPSPPLRHSVTPSPRHSLLPAGSTVGYCTNVHAGADLDGALANLERYAVPIQRLVDPAQPLGVGLWFSARAARQLVDNPTRLPHLRDWLAEHQLLPFTLNGFPHGDFHQPIVKHAVYHPDWTTAARADFTYDLITILNALLPTGTEGSISTLPIGWPPSAPSSASSAPLREIPSSAITSLQSIAADLALLRSTTGRLIHLDLEPEPGCILERSEDAVRLFHQLGDSDPIRTHLRVCHDICHAAVMFEDQERMLRRYAAAGIQVGKVQVSSAVRVNFNELSPQDRRPAFDQLRAFQEDRYLHQTNVLGPGAAAPIFYEDLPLATAAADGDHPTGEWRIHFHVPIYLDSFGLLRTTRDEIDRLLALAASHTCRHFEIETYAWGVLPPPPPPLQKPDLAAGIARELRWFRSRCTPPGGATL